MRSLLHDSSVLRLIQFAIHEDVGLGDVTTEVTIPSGVHASARITAKESGIFCGREIAELVFREFSNEIDWKWNIQEGDSMSGRTDVATLEGPAHALLTGERTMLNFIQRMSGVATKTVEFASLISHTKARLLDTRKTIPGWRLLDKYATSVGGAVNHRIGLYDMIMIKDNHIAAAGGITEAVRRCRDENSSVAMTIEVETQSLLDVKEVLQCEGVSRVMFDNFSPDECALAVDIVAGRLETEASGGINQQTIKSFAESGVDFISCGAITHSAVSLDISMDIIVTKQI